MANTWAQNITLVKKRLGLGTGTAYDSQAEYCLNEAGKILYSVRWRFNREEAGTGSVTAGETLVSDLPDDFGQIDKDMVYITPEGRSKSRLYQGNVRDIIVNPPSDDGTPLSFIITGANDTTSIKEMHVGCPTADVDAAIGFPYWRAWLDWDSEDSGSIHQISVNLGDALLICAATYLFAKFFELETEQKVISADALNELTVLCKVAERREGYTGPSLIEMFKNRT